MIKNNSYTDYRFGKFLVSDFKKGIFIGGDENKETQEDNIEEDKIEKNESEDKFKKAIFYVNDTNEDILTIVDKTNELKIRKEYYEFKNKEKEDEEKKHVNNSFLSFFGFKL